MQTNPESAAVEVAWPDYLMIRDTGSHDDMGGLGQRIYTTAGAGYKKEKYVRASALDALRGEVERLSGELAEALMDIMKAENRADVAERRVAELEADLTKLRDEWQASLGWKGAVVHGTRANIGVIADALTGAEPT